jgi:hypothetical protein
MLTFGRCATTILDEMSPRIQIFGRLHGGTFCRLLSTTRTEGASVHVGTVGANTNARATEELLRGISIWAGGCLTGMPFLLPYLVVQHT